MKYRLREITNDKGYSINYLAVMTDVDKTTLYKMCRNATDAKTSTLLKICNFLGCNMEELVVK